MIYLEIEITMNLNGLGVVLVTASSEQEAKAIATTLIEAKLAACVNITPVHSFYIWEGKINSDPEWQLIIKTALDKFAELSEKVRELHSYSVPEIIALPIVAGSEAYLHWLQENVN
jgi:periplasmic divalent cation tolerance protein